MSGTVPATAAPTIAPQWAAAAAPAGEVASELEDSLLGAFRRAESGLDSAAGALLSGLQGSADAAELAALKEEAATLINEVWEVVDANYLDARSGGFDHEAWRKLKDAALARQYTSKGAVYSAIRDMMARGISDPYCRFIPPSEFGSMKKYDISGAGLNLGTAEEFVLKTGRQLPAGRPAAGGVWVVGLSKGSPADLAGIQQGDQLTGLDGRSLEGRTPFQVAADIAGPEDVSAAPQAVLQVVKADGSSQSVTLQRTSRVLPSPVSYRLERGPGGSKLGVIKLTSFNARAQRDVAAALAALQAGGASALQLDLRDNRGGLVSEGLEVARLFLQDDAPIVLTQSRVMAAAPPRAVGPAATLAPLTVLVDSHTASASEILAGALRDNCRAVLAGSRTYGKGLIQSVYELSDGSGLVVTVGKYLTPAGTDIDLTGIEPQFGSPPPLARAEAALNACRLGQTATPLLATAPAVAAAAASK